MSTYKGTQQISGIAYNTKYNAHNLLDFKWSDHEIDDMSWLRADTFSWQDGTVYTEAYNKLVTSVQDAELIEGKVESGVTFDFYKCTNGLRIVLANQETNIINLYNTSGVAWYYILDTTNQRFKLPRTKYGFVGLRDTVGNFVPESLPNIKGNVGRPATNGTLTQPFLTIGTNTTTGAFELYTATASGDTHISNTSVLNTNSNPSRASRLNASLYSSTYQDNAPVQQKSTQMYLYFYVGEYSQTATEQTAGLNAELFNNKADISSVYTKTEVYTKTQIDAKPQITAPYIKTTYTSGTSGYNIWSNGYCEQWGKINIPSSSVTVNLMKTFSNTNYNVQASNNDCESNINIGSITTSSFKADRPGINAGNMFWVARGYLASGQY